jgi:hypothetical protein
MTATTETPALKDKVEGFLAKTGMAPSTFGLKAVKSSNFVTSLRNGRTPRQPTAAKVSDFIRTAESEHQRALRQGLEAIRRGDGYVQVDIEGAPVNLPKGVDAATFKQLVSSGQLQPGGDSFLGGRPQSFRPI